MTARRKDSGSAPPGWRTLTPRIVTRDVPGLVEFVRAVFEASGELTTQRPTVLTIGDAMLMISAAAERAPMPAFLYVYVADVDALWQRALAAGAQALEAPARVPYGDRRAMFADRWGNLWQVATWSG